MTSCDATIARASARADEEIAETEIARLRRLYGRLNAQSFLRAMIEQEFRGRIAAVSSFGAESAVILALIARIGIEKYTLLQSGSAELSDALFKLAGVPFFRTDFLFALPGVTIEIAKECSGIRSSLALLITSLLAGYVCLQSAWTRMILILVTFPLLIVKNGIRIVTLSTLAIYADPSFLTGKLHSQGGFVFFLLALAILAPVLWLLQRAEANRELPRVTRC